MVMDGTRIVDVSVNGVVVLAGAACTGSFDAVPFDAATGDIISTSNWNPGSWPGEISWEILDGDNAIIASGVVNDIISVSANCPSCSSPSNITLNNISSSSAIISWNGLGNETAWNTEFGPSGFTLGTGTVGGLFTDSIILNGLNQQTSYDFYVQSYCGNGDFSSWSGPFTFITLEPSFNITLEVNTASIYNNGGVVGPNGIYAGGGFLGDATALQLTQSSTDTLVWSGIASISQSVASGFNNYIFLNSPNSGGDWGTKEILSGLSCSDPNNYDDRILPNISSDTTIKHCFGSCETDGSCPLLQY